MKINGQDVPDQVTHEQAIDYIMNTAVGREAYKGRGRDELVAELRQQCPSEAELNAIWTVFRVTIENMLAPKIGPYTLLDHGHVIRCNTCMKVSWNSNDVIYRYCGHCKKFHED